MKVKIILFILLVPGLVSAKPGTPTDTATSLKVMSYNIRIASPPSKGWGHTELEAIASVINREKPDLVALQEVDVYTERSGKGSHQAKELAALTGMYWHFAKAIDRSGGDYGVAVLSRFPIQESRSYRLPVSKGSDGEIRGCSFIIVEALSMQIGFMSAHLDHRSDKDRLLQVKVLNKILKQHRSIPIIFGADLNMGRDNKVIRKLEKQVAFMCSTCEPTFPADKPDRTLDYIMLNDEALRHFEMKRYELGDDRYASDHLPLLMELSKKAN